MHKEKMFSIIVVCLNAGERLQNTLESIWKQSCSDYEVIVKDGGSTDGSLACVPDKDNVHLYIEKDTGIYDAMNQAVRYTKGEYLLFLNTGDLFYDVCALEKIASVIKSKKQEDKNFAGIVYGNLYHLGLETIIYASSVINDFTCYRNVPCHQTCFYHRSMFDERGYDTRYNVRADYEHFLWCYYVKKTRFVYTETIVASYEGGGYSETKENRRRSAKQHKEIVIRYMGKGKYIKYRAILLATLAPVRSKLAESERFSKLYNSLKAWIYKRKG
ncbi:MAG: glycosyltransferase [Lachnospiraceae bacterium]|nr:glycosyltransferase [Lachnospiraceae bacterium]